LNNIVGLPRLNLAACFFGGMYLLTTVYFVRHAHSTYTTDELGRPLSEKGLKDAEKIAQILKDKKVDHVISSPYKRAIQSVQGVARNSGTEIELIDGFKERRLSAGSVRDFNSAISKVWQDFNFSLDGGESSNAAQKRGMEALLKTLDTYEGKNIVIGTHGNIMVLIMNYFNEEYDFDFWKQLEMPDIYQLTFEKTTLIKVEKIWR
jgi:2,3-bisphosphoglycerate-dependent phosphoglycerate mutase